MRPGSTFRTLYPLLTPVFAIVSCACLLSTSVTVRIISFAASVGVASVGVASVGRALPLWAGLTVSLLSLPSLFSLFSSLCPCSLCPWPPALVRVYAQSSASYSWSYPRWAVALRGTVMILRISLPNCSACFSAALTMALSSPFTFARVTGASLCERRGRVNTRGVDEYDWLAWTLCDQY